jgi:hypothetical protein
MAIFQSDKGFHFSENGDHPWAHFRRVAGSWPPVYRFETDDPHVIDRLAGIAGVITVDGPVSATPLAAST